MNEKKIGTEIKWFLGIVIALSIPMEFAIIYFRALGLAVFLMVVPAMAAFIVVNVFERGQKHRLNFRLCQVKYILQAIMIPLTYIGLPYLLYWAANPQTLEPKPDKKFFLFLLICIPFSMITAIWEEIGWRGFWVPRMYQKYGLTKTLLLTSLFWGCWHIPVLASGLYMPGTPVSYAIPLFLINVMASGVIAGILTIRSGSVWPSVFLHSAHNGFDQMVFGAYTVGENKMYFVSETGVITAVCSVLIAVFMWYQCVKAEQKGKGSGEII